MLFVPSSIPCPTRGVALVLVTQVVGHAPPRQTATASCFQRVDACFHRCAAGRWRRQTARRRAPASRGASGRSRGRNGRPRLTRARRAFRCVVTAGGWQRSGAPRRRPSRGGARRETAKNLQMLRSDLRRFLVRQGGVAAAACGTTGWASSRARNPLRNAFVLPADRRRFHSERRREGVEERRQAARRRARARAGLEEAAATGAAFLGVAARVEHPDAQEDLGAAPEDGRDQREPREQPGDRQADRHPREPARQGAQEVQRGARAQQEAAREHRQPPRVRLVFDQIYKKLEKELAEKKKEMARIIEISNKACEARDAAQQEMAALKHRPTRSTSSRRGGGAAAGSDDRQSTCRRADGRRRSAR